MPMLRPNLTVKDMWKFICELSPAEVLYRPWNGTFYVQQSHVEISDGACLISPTQAGKTANAAVIVCFSQYTTNSPKVVIDSYTPRRREVRWNPLCSKWQNADSDIVATHLIT